LTYTDISSNLLVSTTTTRKETILVDYAILATLWNGPATMPELVAAVYDRMGRPVSPSLIDSYLRLLERGGFIQRDDPRSPYKIAERGSLYLANTAVSA
jgi:DNA-binding PadR family transcriptional regulator